MTPSSSDATTRTTVLRGTDNGYRAELDGLPGQRIGSSASFVA
jgi:hypothetical protein